MYTFRPTIREFSADRQQAMGASSSGFVQEESPYSSPTIEDGRRLSSAESQRSKPHRVSSKYHCMLY